MKIKPYIINETNCNKFISKKDIKKDQLRGHLLGAE